jgi:hypothetical protein
MSKLYGLANFGGVRGGSTVFSTLCSDCRIGGGRYCGLQYSILPLSGKYWLQKNRRYREGSKWTVEKGGDKERRCMGK